VADRSKRHLERVLRECAQSGVTDKASPWPEIRERLGGRGTDEARAVEARAVEGRAMGAPRTRRPFFVPDRPLGWALAALSVLILGLGAYAASGPVRELFVGPLGPESPGPGEVVMGTPGKDRIDRGDDDHTIRALAGDDTVFDTGGRNVAYGGDGNDWMIVTGSVYGGPGEDQLEPFGGAKASGGPGADVIYAHNDERNAVSCGPGNDTVYFDGKLDSLATDCEKQIPRQFEPPLNVPFDD
jgi:hypothetical protein